MTFKVSETMEVIFDEEKQIDYLVLKVGGQTYSTPYSEIKTGSIKGKLQIVKTKGIGEQSQLWLKGNFTEKENHVKLEKEIPFEINIYFHNK